MKTCINCNTTLNESDKYCPECGQSTNNALTLKTLFADLVGNYLSFDARFFKTIIPLVFKPGFVAKSFVTGKRNTYLHPGKFYLFISVVFFFILSVKTSTFRSEINQNIYESLSETVHIADSLKSDSIQVDSLQTDSTLASFTLVDTAEIQDSTRDMEISIPSFLVSENVFIRQIGRILEHKGQNMFNVFFNMISIAIFLLVPVYALLLTFLFYKTQYTFTQNLVFSLYLFAFSFILAMLYLSVYNFDEEAYILYGFCAVFLTYLTYSFKHFYKKTFSKSLFRAIIQSSVFTVILLPTTFILLILASIYFY